jgi:hypothetical protein
MYKNLSFGLFSAGYHHPVRGCFALTLAFDLHRFAVVFQFNLSALLANSLPPFAEIRRRFPALAVEVFGDAIASVGRGVCSFTTDWALVVASHCVFREDFPGILTV